MRDGIRLATRLAAMAIMVAMSSVGHADIIIDKLVIQLQSGGQARDDVEIWNNSSDRAYVVVQASEILRPGQADQERIQITDPRQLGLLASPARLILEPDQHRLMRLAVLAQPTDLERVYRVTVKPVLDETAVDEGLQLLVGYDLLVLVRPQSPTFSVISSISGGTLELENQGNASVELLTIEQCPKGADCVTSPGGRLYAGVKRSFQLNGDGEAKLTFSTADGMRTVKVR